MPNGYQFQGLNLNRSYTNIYIYIYILIITKTKPQQKREICRKREWRHTELGKEEQEHDDGGGESDNATGEGTAVEILVDFGIRIQVPKLAHYIVHCSFSIFSVSFAFFRSQKHKEVLIDLDLFHKYIIIYNLSYILYVLILISSKI